MPQPERDRPAGDSRVGATSARPATIVAWFRRLGPGLITGAADDDPGGIATHSQVGAQFGLNLMWTVVLTYPLMSAIQSICARIGRVTGAGLAANMTRVLPRPLVGAIVLLLFVANTVNIGADLAAMGAAAQLVVGRGETAFAILFAATAISAHGQEPCLLFDGMDDQVIMPNAVLNNIGTGTFTVEAWVRGVESQQPTHPRILSNRDVTNNGFMFGLHGLWGGSAYKML